MILATLVGGRAPKAQKAAPNRRKASYGGDGESMEAKTWRGSGGRGDF